MANEEQLAILRQGLTNWFIWRAQNPNAKIDLREADFQKANLSRVDLSSADLNGANFGGANLSEANFIGAILSGANLSEALLSGTLLYSAYLISTDLSRMDLSNAKLTNACLIGANLTGANLRGASLRGANLDRANLSDANLSGADLQDSNLSGANLSGSDLKEADLTNANLSKADLTNADLKGANLIGALLIGTIIEGAIISGSWIYAVNVWDLEGEFKEQKDLVIQPLPPFNRGEIIPVITIDNIKVAQFIYLILKNEEIRDVINTLTSKSVLILGRFSIPERKAILDALKNKLREYDLLPIVFDFDRPTDKDFTETIKTLAGLCYFVIADVTNPKSSPLELQAVVPDYQIPFVPIIQEGELPFAMMVDLQKKYNWVLNTVTYDSMETLIKVLKPLIIDPAMKKRQELRLIKAQEPEVISGKDYLEKGKE